ncbi:DUF4861 domain-containing protein [Aquimarina addita]|uniref:DUF4861 domain-containing protein n=1 Tax=Aquimarina addita TaxID=870485 RepID=A0ABP6USS7_9FLAO
MKVYKILVVIVMIISSLSSCKSKIKAKTFTVTNTLNIERSYETLTLPKDFFKVKNLDSLGIRDLETGTFMITQLVDIEGDGIMDELLFQPTLAPMSEKVFEIVSISKNERPEAKDYCYSRFVPERTDDYAWENDRVAFRTFGPTAQKMVEDSIKGGTLTNGIDAWLKKVPYPIINNWYKKNSIKQGAYHDDSPEGLDNFHVGTSRGVGGIAVKKDSIYYSSKNFISHRTITTGPIRTSFYLTYKDWDAGGAMIKESKIISLDLGSNFSKYELSIEGTDSLSVGLTLHKKEGIVSGDIENSWLSYWEPHDDSELGMAIIGLSDNFLGYETYDSNQKDTSHAYAHLKVIDASVIFYAGFGWKERGQFTTKEAWEKHVAIFSKKISNPMTVVYN